MQKCMKPGTDNAKEGTYIEVGPNGQKIKNARVVQIQSGDRLPATSKKGNLWMLK